MDYKDIYFKLNELAIVNDWSDKLNSENPFLFEIENIYINTYSVKLKDFTKLHEMVEGVEHTPKIKVVLEKLVELILIEIPEISTQNDKTTLLIKNGWYITRIVFTDEVESKYYIE